jgi:hypothetical protein
MSGVFRQAPGRGEGDHPAWTEQRGGRPGTPLGPRYCVQSLTERGGTPLFTSLLRVRDCHRKAEMTCRAQHLAKTGRLGESGNAGRIEPVRRHAGTLRNLQGAQL